MNILLVYPEYPETYWSFKHALKFIAKRSANVPLGILTVASLLPREWNKRFTDMNVTGLKGKDIIWADYVFISAISIQSESVRKILDQCAKYRKKIVGGGPLFSEEIEQFGGVDHLVLDEAEITLPEFITDLRKGTPKRIYKTDLYADITCSPLPDYSLVRLNKYATAAIQYSRGCPYDCEFCDITALYGRKVRTKTSGQIIDELDQLYAMKWKGSVFFVDDNFIGHKKRLKSELLPAIIEWMEQHEYPFHFITEASINMADDRQLMDMMVRAGFMKVFIGIETPEEICLTECNKSHNNNRNLIDSVHQIQKTGIEVAAGFIVGFDNDPPTIFQRQIDFIQKSGIITAMVGLLNAPRFSRLYARLAGEGRILQNFSGDNTDYSINFIPVMDKEKLLEGYRKILHGIYSSKFYYQRLKLFLKEYNPPFRDRLTFGRLIAFIRSVFLIGVFRKNQRYYWDLIFWSLFNRPRIFPLAVTYSIYGYHFQKVFRGIS